MRTDTELVDDARKGVETDFAELVRRHESRIRLHCYRMLGSLHDADDATQETMIKAWRRIGSFEGRSTFGTWLYRIATTTCLNMLRSRPRVVVPEGFSDRHRPHAADLPWLEPYPDVLMEVGAGWDPAARIEAKEATRLAFVAAIQLLPARQRAVLLLRDVLAWKADEVATALDTTVAAVTSALQRARSRLTEQREWEQTTPEVESVVDEWMRCWERCDIEGLVALLTDDAVLAMPPAPAWFSGPAEIGTFFATVPAKGKLDTIRLVRARSNGQPAVAAYMMAPDGRFVGYGVMVFDLSDDRIAVITGFNDARLIGRFGLPVELGR
ncbi:MAG: RNA polymerase subunit sigma-70 [Acidimicrobiia bacterium]